MRRTKKNIKKYAIIIMALITVIIVGELSIRFRLNLSKHGVSKALFSDSYFIKAQDYETKIESFKRYMLKDGWKFSENYDQKIIFRKGNLQKEIPIKDLRNI